MSKADLQHTVARVLSRWPLIFGVTSIVTLAVVLVPAQYRISTSILLVEVNQFGQTSSLPFSLESGPNPLDITHRIFRSHDVSSIISAKSGVPLNDVSSYVRTSLDMSSNSITFYVIDWESNLKKATAALDAGLEGLSQKTAEIAISKAKIKAELISKSMSGAFDKLRISRAKLLEAQRKTTAGTSPASLKLGLPFLDRVAELRFQLGTVSARLNASTQEGEKLSQHTVTSVSALPSLEEWRKKIAELEFDLQRESVAYGSEAPVVRLKVESLQKAKDSAKKELAVQLEALKTQATKEQVDLLSQQTVLRWQLNEASRLVELASGEANTLAELQLEYESQEIVYRQLREQYEQAKVESEVDLIRWRRLEKPYKSYRPTNKRYVAYPLYSFIGSLLLVLLYEINRKHKKG